MKRSITVSAVQHLTPDSTTLFFAWPYQAPAQAGQYVQLTAAINSVLHTRSYSIHPGQTETEVGVTVKHIAGGLVSGFIQHLEPGASLWIEGPMGNFTVQPSEQPRQVYLLAGGSGITPIYAMVKQQLAENPEQHLSLLFVNHQYNRIIFRDELAALEASSNGKLTVDHIVSDATGAPEGFKLFSIGRPGKLMIKTWLRIRRKGNLPEEFYLCGPHGLLEVFQQALTQSGASTDCIFKEHFFVPTTARQQSPTFPDQTIELRWQNEVRNLTVPSGKNILQAAMDAGLPVPFSCQKGQCGTCVARVTSGRIYLANNFALTSEQIGSGLTLLCQSHPATEGVKIELSPQPLR